MADELDVEAMLEAPYRKEVMFESLFLALLFLSCLCTDKDVE